MGKGIGLGVGINRSNYAQGIFGAYRTRVIADGGVVEAGVCVDAVSSLLQSASLLLVPSGYKSGVAYSEIPTNGNGDLTWSRASTAYRTNASGIIEEVAWNLLTQSEDFSSASWIKSNLSVTSNSTSAPNGTITADTIVPNSTNAYHPISQSATVLSGAQHTFSIYAKSAGYDFLLINTTAGSLSGNVGPLFNLANGTLIGSLGGNNYGATITSVGDGWYRIVFSYTTNATSTIIDINSLPTSTISTYSGNGTSGLYLYGAQLVVGTDAKTYLPVGSTRNNYPRLSYMYGSCPALLAEPQRTNVNIVTEDFRSGGWTLTNINTTADIELSPSGIQNADLCTANGTSGVHRVNQNAWTTLAATTTYTFSIYAKKGTNNFIQLSGGPAYTTGTTFANFDLNNGVLGTVGTGTTATINSVGNGWYRCTMTATTDVSSNQQVNNILIVSSASSPINESNTLTTSVYLWGGQTESGAYASSYIPNSGLGSATRVADSFSRNNIYTNGLISASGGTWFVELRNNVAYTLDASEQGINLGDNATQTLGNQFQIRSVTANERMVISKRVSNLFTQLYVTTTSTTKIAIKWNGSTADVFANGTKVVSATAFTATALEFLTANVLGTPKFIQQMALFPTPLSDSQLTQLTTL